MANENLHLGSHGFYLITYYEGCRLTAYWDDIGGVWTIGWGHTGDVYSGETLTQQQADDLLRQDLLPREDSVKSLITVTLTQYEFDALVSFVYNCGSGALEGDMANMINSGNKAGAMDILMQYVHGNGGVFIQGLYNRRLTEKSLFLYDDLSSIGGSVGGDTGGGGDNGGGGTSGNYKLKNNYIYGATDKLFGRKFTSKDKQFTLVSTVGDIAIIKDSVNREFRIPKKNLISV